MATNQLPGDWDPELQDGPDDQSISTSPGAASPGMDPLGARLNIVEEKELCRWVNAYVPSYPEAQEEERESRFPVNEDFNRKVVLWEGDITALNCTAIVNTTNETLTDRNLISERIFQAAGPDLRAECSNHVKTCRTGEAKMTKGYNLPARYVIHTVGPRYNVKYRTAAESALFNCYRNSLQLARENSLQSIGLCVVNQPKRGYPPDEGAHIALRTVRRFLEKYDSSLETVVFAVTDNDEDIYRRIMPLYFPRTKAEEQAVLDEVPTDVGNEEGEPFIQERQIRIMDKPLGAEDSTEADETFEEGLLGLGGKVGAHGFATMEGDHDKARMQQLQGKNSEEQVLLEQQRRYQRWLKRSKTDDLSDIAALRVLYQSGSDIFGRPVVVIVGRNFPVNVIDLDKALLYFIQVMDPIVSKDYVVVYFHTQSTDDNQPELSFLRSAYNLLDNKYKKNLKAFYIVHPTFWSRIVTWFFTTFTASSIKDKVRSVQSVQELYHTIPPEQLDIPPFVLDHDIQLHGPMSQSTSNPDFSSSEDAGNL
ncbi:GDAP2 [Branchiostoma lanceolatum]|uniref:GDAP2 protein n=2 Tax=Branchiostoma lanceolatum TaxID=7740 RepID=A0A8J9W579_BRALA|nr:GDAP2 [Branchiostoma lanceolatum]